MLKVDFDKCIENLRAFYGPKRYAEQDELDKLMRFAMSLTRADFDAIILEFVATHPMPPTVAAICGACHRRRNSIIEKAKAATEMNLGSCKWCQGSGFTVAIKREPTRGANGNPIYYDFAFRCTCGAQDRLRLSASITRWDEEKHAKDYCRGLSVADALNQLRKEQEP